MKRPKDLCSCEDAPPRDAFGPIAGDEKLGRVVLSPNHVRKDGKSIKPGVIPVSHVLKQGLSLMRLDMMGDEDKVYHANAIAGNLPDNQALGFIICDTQQMRELKDEDGLQAVCVFEDPVIADDKLPDNPAHACSLKTYIFEEGSKYFVCEDDEVELVVRQLREKMLEFFSDLVPLPIIEE